MFFVAIKIPKKMKIITAICLIAFGAISLQSMLDPIMPVAGKLSPLTRIGTDQKIVAFTFDISWGEVYPMKVLDVLKKEKIRATFFISGPWTSTHLDVAERIAKDGHEIGSHGYRHKNLSTFSREQIVDEIKKAEKIIKDATRKTPHLFRPPNGDYNDTVINTAKELGYETVNWSADSIDWWPNQSKEVVIQRTLKRVHNGAIVLFHASDSAPLTPEVIPVVVRELRKQGYKIVTVSQLLKTNKSKQHKN